MEKQFSLVCIVNKEKIYDEFKRNVDTQEAIEYELVPINNTHNEFSSARKAYNSIANKIRGNYIVFLHPDIRFLNNEVLSNIYSYICDLKENGVVGVAGSKGTYYGKGEIITSIVHGEDKHTFGRLPINPEEVQTVDECLFIVEKKYFLEHPFSEREGWHLYAVEYCLEAIKNGKKNYVVPADIWHMSEGKSLDEKYVEQVEDIIKDWQSDFDVIYTTIKTWKTRGLGASIYRKYYWLKQRTKRAIVRR